MSAIGEFGLLSESLLSSRRHLPRPLPMPAWRWKLSRLPGSYGTTGAGSGAYFGVCLTPRYGVHADWAFPGSQRARVRGY